MALQEEFKRQGDFLFKYRGHLPLLIIAAGLAVFVWEVANGNPNSLSGYFSFKYGYELCFMVGIVGVVIRAHVVGHAPDRTSGRNIHGQVAEVLNTKGLYSTVRHPLYVGNFFMWLGVALLTGNAWFVVSFILFYVIYYERIMYAEEAFLRNKFDTKYLTWAEGVPAAIPNFSLYQKTENSFNLKKVLKKEKNGVLALFLLFWIFEVIENSILNMQLGKENEIELSIWFYGTMITLFYYLVLKIKKIAKRK